jgi:hypothetical protein
MCYACAQVSRAPWLPPVVTVRAACDIDTRDTPLRLCVGLGQSRETNPSASLCGSWPVSRNQSLAHPFCASPFSVFDHTSTRSLLPHVSRLPLCQYSPAPPPNSLSLSLSLARSLTYAHIQSLISLYHARKPLVCEDGCMQHKWAPEHST